MRGNLFVSVSVWCHKAKWGSILPAVFKAAAEGDLGSGVKWFYWRAAGYKTVTGAVLLGAGVGLEAVCSSYPDIPLSCQASHWCYLLGTFLTSVGLVDGGTRAPWPDGTPKEK